MCLRLDSSRAYAAVLALWKAKVVFLLLEKVINYAVFLLELALDHEESRLDFCVFVFEVIRGHSLLHNVVVKSLSFLIDLLWAQLADFNLDHLLGFGTYWCVTSGIAG